MNLAQTLLERYEQLILENYKLSTELENSVPMDVHLALTRAIENSFKIEANYRDEPTLKFDYKNFLSIVEDLLAKSKYASKYKVRDVDSLYEEIIFGVFEKITEDDEDEEDQA